MQKVKNTMESKKYKKRFVLVHGLCHGAWTWYKLKTQLEAAGHYVTVVDLAASGINMTSLEEIETLKDYCKPLLEFLNSLCSDDEKVILIAHSMGGICAALAADIFPCKIAVIVFMTAFMPDTRNPPSYVYQKLITSFAQEDWLDTVFGTYGKPDHPLEFALFGPNFMATNLYQLSPPEGQEVLARIGTDLLHVFLSYVERTLQYLRITSVG
ncbi:methylesterase 4 isoform X3 [Brassica rapa]|uniref:methylesterase 4 isoform X3 n=1 Tax=Brassica campestris TaxID=3711 RepID=UPI000BBEFB3C|nr:methylesterase 4 isoform X3 [Brassica rapa]